MKTEQDTINIKSVADGQEAAWRTYARFTVGSPSLPRLLRYELLMALCAARGGALGIALRKLVYPSMLGSLGKGTVIGQNVTLRGCANIHIGRRVLIDEGCLLDARGPQADIRIGDGVIISSNTIIRARNAHLEIGEGSDIGVNCLLATDSRLEIGREVLVAAYSYLIAGGQHRFDEPEPIIMRQGMLPGKGIQVGDGAWIGARSSVLDGADIGAGSVIGAHALVTRPIPAMSIAYGSPATVRRTR